MADTEFHYIDIDSEKLWDEAMRVYIDQGGDVLYPGDEKEMLLRSAMVLGMTVLAKVENALRMDTLTYAQGEYLKEYGKKRNCYYIEAVAATAPVKITLQPTGIARTIPAGTELTADGTILYTLQEDIEQTGAAQEIETTIICATAGTVGNGLREGTQMQFVESSEAAAAILVTGDASGGADAEDLEAYRQRIHDYGLASVTTGPSSIYESRAMEVSPQIIAARALNDGAGEVGIYLLLEDGADQERIFYSVEQALSAITERPLTDHVQAHAAAERAYTLNVEVRYDSYAVKESAVQDAIAAYQRWQDDTIGRAFDPGMLIAVLYQIGCRRVRFLEGSGMDGSVEYTEIGERERCKGEIVLTAVNI